MTAVIHLIPGDRIIAADGRTATFVAQTIHPLHPRNQLVVSRWDDDGTWSHDGLHPAHDVQVVPASNADRNRRLRDALPGELTANGGRR